MRKAAAGPKARKLKISVDRAIGFNRGSGVNTTLTKDVIIELLSLRILMRPEDFETFREGQRYKEWLGQCQRMSNRLAFQKLAEERECGPLPARKKLDKGEIGAYYANNA